MEQNSNNIPELQSPFEQLRAIDADGKEWWNSRKLARVMGYGKYWNFERVIAKAQAWTSQKGYHLGEHFVEITEMAELGSGAVREVTSIRLSRAACMAVAMNADQKKEMVKAAQQYFSATMTPDVAVRSMESSILIYKGGRGKVQVQVIFDTNTFWLSQQRMAELFGVTQQNISYHLSQIEESGELHLSDAYKKILLPSDKYSECSSDYVKDSDVTQLFFKTVQNMMHYAVTKQTAAEIIYDRADAERPHMGLTTWKNAPDGRVIKSDVTVAKNYLSEKEVDSLNRLSNAFIDIAEQRAEDHILMTMADWSALLQRYMDLNNRPLLPDAGRVTHEQAVEKALTEYDKFRVIQDREIMSDFDKQLKLLFGDMKD